MKIEENKPHSIHLRLNDKQYNHCKQNADLLGVGVSEYVRMMINGLMVINEKMAEEAKTLGDLGNADNKNDIEHKL